jgi:hypothetical protein
MTKKNLLFGICVIVLAASYVIFFTDWFKAKTVEINYTVRYLHARNPRGNPQPLLVFILGTPLKLTEIKVVPLAGYLTNKNILPLWHLVSGSNSEPVKTFSYGDYSHAIKGMSPALEGIAPEPLATNVIYHLLVNAGKIKGEHDFELR